MAGAFDYFQFVLAPQIVIGLVLGVAVILVALGLTIIFGLLDVINMSHGEFYALGAFIGVSLASIGVPFWLLLILVPLLMLPIGYLVERVLIQRVFHSPDRHVTTLLLTFGLALVMEDAFRLIWGPNPIRPETPIRGAVELAGIFLPLYRALHDRHRRADHRRHRACWSIERASARWCAPRPSTATWRRRSACRCTWVYAGAFAFGVSLAALAGVLLAPIYSVFPTMGRDFILMAFTVVIVGGMGSIAGAVVAGLFLTQVQAIASLYISPVWTDPIVFGIMVIMLMVRPQGLFGRLGHG